jgi:hypothetical protein
MLLDQNVLDHLAFVAEMVAQTLMARARVPGVLLRNPVK